MTTFERYFINTEEVNREVKGVYYELANKPETCDFIMREFGLDAVSLAL